MDTLPTRICRPQHCSCMIQGRHSLAGRTVLGVGDAVAVRLDRGDFSLVPSPVLAELRLHLMRPSKVKVRPSAANSSGVPCRATAGAQPASMGREGRQGPVHRVRHQIAFAYARGHIRDLLVLLLGHNQLLGDLPITHNPR